MIQIKILEKYSIKYLYFVGAVRYVFGIRAHNSAGQTSDVSNLVTVSINRHVRVSPAFSVTALILTSLFTSLFIISLIIIFIVCVNKLRKTEKQREKVVEDKVKVKSTWRGSLIEHVGDNTDDKECDNIYKECV